MNSDKITKSEKDLREGAAGRPSIRRWWILLPAVCLIILGVYLFWSRTGSGQTSGAKKGAQARAVPVLAAAAKKGDMAIYLNGLGTVTPLNTVSVRTRVDGQLMEVLFKEGQIVKAGDLLAKIDPRPFEVQLTQAEGQMARDQALLKNAQLDLQRYRVLWQQDSIPKQQLDTQEALVRQYEGAVKVDQGQIDSTRLQLIYCRITSPINGRVGLRLVDPGNIVRASDANGLLVITQLQPIAVIFPIPEDNVPQVLKRLNKGEKMSVEAYDRAQKAKLATGTLLTVDNQVDTSTGTVKFKATFANTTGELFPSQFVNARLLADVRRSTIIIPAAALQRGPQGAFVYVLKTDRTVTVRPITVRDIQGGEASVTSGLAEGEVIIVDGAERLREGALTEPKMEKNDTTRRGH